MRVSSGFVRFCSPLEPEQCEACLNPDRCEEPSYTDAGVGTVMSSCCGLVWQQMPDSTRYTWAEAQEHCASLMLDGSGWRLPTLGELLSVPGSSFMPALDLAWTATEALSVDKMMYVNLGDGFAHSFDVDNRLGALCVR